MSAPAPDSIRVIDPDGDVLLIVPAPQEGYEIPTPSQFLVSSKSLIPASTLFKARFVPNGRDARELAEKGSINIHLENTAHYPDAMHIVLNIIHGLNQPIRFSFDAISLWKVVLATHYFLCYEALQSWGLWWCERLLPKLPTEFLPSSWKWIFISYVFGDHTLFQHLTMMAQQRTTGSIYAGPSPIPEWILEEIFGKRDDFLKRCFDLVWDQITYLASPYIHCTLACDTKKAAALMQYIQQFPNQGRSLIEEKDIAASPCDCSPFLFCQAAKIWINPEHQGHGTMSLWSHIAHSSDSHCRDYPEIVNAVFEPLHPLNNHPCVHENLLGEELSDHVMQMGDQLQGIPGILDRHTRRQ